MGTFMYKCQDGFMPDSITSMYTTVQWRGDRGWGTPPSDNFLGALKFAIANVKYL